MSNLVLSKIDRFKFLNAYITRQNCNINIKIYLLLSLTLFHFLIIRLQIFMWIYGKFKDIKIHSKFFISLVVKNISSDETSIILQWSISNGLEGSVWYSLPKTSIECSSTLAIYERTGALKRNTSLTPLESFFLISDRLPSSQWSKTSGRTGRTQREMSMAKREEKNKKKKKERVA